MNTTYKTKNNKQSMSDPNENKQGYKKTKLGWIPEEWKTDKLRNIFTLASGQSKPSDYCITKDVNYIYPIYGGNGIIGYSRKALFSANKIIIGRVGEKCGIINLSTQHCWITDNALYTKEIDENRIHLIFLTYYLSFRKLSRLRNSTGQPLISQKPIYNLSIPIPPLPEQQKIAQILSTWDRAIEQTEKLIEKKQRLKKGLMQQLFKGKMRFKEFQKNTDLQNTKIGLVPKEWETKKAYEIFENVSVKNNDEHEDLLSATQDYGVVPRNLLEGKVTMPNGNLKAFKLVEKGDFVISLRTFQGGIEYSFYRGLVSPAYTVLKEKLPIDKDFYRHLFKTKDFISRLASSVIGIRDGKQINYSDFKLMKIIYPPIEEQKKIAKLLNGLEQEIQIWKEYNDKLKQQKKGLMQQLLTGKTRVKIN